MFGFRRKNIDGIVTVEIPYIKENLEKIISEKLPNFVECEFCGCLLKKETAIKGESKIVKIKDTNGLNVFGDFVTNDTEKIQEVYFCKIHKPKSK